MKTKKICLLFITSLFISCKNYENKLWLFVSNYSECPYTIHISNEDNDFFFNVKQDSLCYSDGFKVKNIKNLEFLIDVIENGEIKFSQKISKESGTVLTYSVYGGSSIDLLILQGGLDPKICVLEKPFDFEYGELKKSRVDKAILMLNNRNGW